MLTTKVTTEPHSVLSTQYSVLFLAGEYPPRPGGVGDYTALLAHHLAQQGLQISVLATQPDPHPHTQYSALSTQYSPVRTQHSPDPVPVLRRVRRWDWRCAPAVAAAVRAARPDLVHVQYQPAAFGLEAAVSWLPGWLRRRCSGVRSVVTFHDLRVPYLCQAGPLRAAVRDRLLRGADAAIFTDPADWAAAARIRPTGRHWIPIGSNIPVAPPSNYDRATWRRRAGADEDTLLLAHLGLLNRTKGVTTLLETLAHLRAAGRRVRLLLVGAEPGESDPANRAYADEVERRIAALGLGDLVQRTPHLPVAEVSAYLLAADAAAFPFADGASLRRGSLLAALAHGLPTVSTLPATPLLRDGGTLLLVPPDDPAAFAAALARLVDDAPLRSRLAAGGPALVATLTWPRIAAAHRAVYRTLLEQSDRGVPVAQQLP